MPYRIDESEGKFLVVNEDTGDVKGEHPSRAKAEAQMRALYANEPDAKSMKVGRRNSSSDSRKLEQIRDLVIELIGAELEESEAEEVAGKSIDVSHVPDSGKNEWAVKSIGDGVIKGYVAMWGNPDQTDLEYEYFTKDTNFWDGQLKDAPRPLTWDHAQDKDFKGNPVIGTITEMGDDEIGRWYVAKLDRSHQYNKAIEALVKAGKLGTSSDSAPQYVERVKMGKAVWLKTWPLFAAALTDTPCEPRMVGSLEYLKSIGVELPDNHTRDWQWAAARMKRNRLETQQGDSK
jgi:hypothetical protein